jgi:hypothetical protein
MVSDHGTELRFLRAQQARNLLMDLGERAARFKFLIRDQDSKFTKVFNQVLAGNGARIIKTSVRSPRANSYSAAPVAGTTTSASRAWPANRYDRPDQAHPRHPRPDQRVPQGCLSLNPRVSRTPRGA